MKFCETCQGDGELEKRTPCGKSVHSCCGGCYETVTCPDCDGEGEVMEVCEWCDHEYEEGECLNCEG